MRNMTWRLRLRQLLREGSFGTQGELVALLDDAGYSISQATLSRELTRLGAQKVDGSYVLPSGAGIGAPIHGFECTAGDCIVVVETDPAYANVVGQAVDDAELQGVLGCVAGDNTVIIATSGPEATAALRDLFGVEAP